MELEVDDIGPSIRMATAKITKAARDKHAKNAPLPEPTDPWAGTAAPAQEEEPPF